MNRVVNGICRELVCRKDLCYSSAFCRIRKFHFHLLFHNNTLNSNDDSHPNEWIISRIKMFRCSLPKQNPTQQHNAKTHTKAERTYRWPRGVRVGRTLDSLTHIVGQHAIFTPNQTSSSAFIKVSVRVDLSPADSVSQPRLHSGTAYIAARTFVRIITCHTLLGSLFVRLFGRIAQKGGQHCVCVCATLFRCWCRIFHACNNVGRLL